MHEILASRRPAFTTFQEEMLKSKEKERTNDK